MGKKWIVVNAEHGSGIYAGWEQAKKYVVGKAGASCKGFNKRSDAEEYFRKEVHAAA